MILCYHALLMFVCYRVLLDVCALACALRRLCVTVCSQMFVPYRVHLMFVCYRVLSVILRYHVPLDVCVVLCALDIYVLPCACS